MDIKAINQTHSAQTIHSSNTNIHQQNDKISTKEGNKSDFDNIPQNIKDDIIQKRAKELNEKIKMLHTSLKIEIDKETNIQVVKIIDEKTKEVIKQLPPDTMLKIAKYIDEITGLLFEKRA